MRSTASLLLCLLSLFVCQLKASSSATSFAAGAAAAATAPSCRDDDDSTTADAVDLVRGGDAIADDCVDDIDFHTRSVLRRFLDAHPTTIEGEEPSFHVHGWRWHYMALVRDSKRLETLAHRVSSSINDGGNDGGVSEEDLEALASGAEYVVNFNMAGLFRIEADRSSKFLREHLCDAGSDSSSPIGSEEAAAFRKLADRWDELRAQSEKVGRTLVDQTKKASEAKQPQQQQKLLREIAASSSQLRRLLSSDRSLHESLIVPSLSRVVSPKVQKSFNNKVLLSLGILESRLHLVGMHDAVHAPGVDKVERDMFQQEIPYMGRMMIERWRRSLYDPKAGALEGRDR